MESVVQLALRRFEEETQADAKVPESKRWFGYSMQYADIVENFVAAGNRVSSYDISRIEKSRYAIPLTRLREVKGETSMSWTQFTAVMKDGREFAFGTPFLMEFFQMPAGYVGEDIAGIIPHKGGEPVYRDRPYFTCYVKGL